MRNRYAVLRGIRGMRTREPFAGSVAVLETASLPGILPEPRVEVTDLTPANLRDLGRDPEVAAIAPAMPTRLIQPFEVAPGAAAKSAWGVGAIKADASAFDGAGVVAAVLDTGIDAGHPAFAGVTLVQQDFSGDGNGDRNGHGTHCAGTMFGRDIGLDRIGIARGVSRALVGKVLGDSGGGQSTWIFQALQWALTSGARVISMSLGLDFTGLVRDLIEQEGWPPALAASAALEAYRGNLRMFDAIMGLVRARTALDGGAVVVAAAGNESRRDLDPNYEIAASLPAAAEGVISVGALDRAPAGYTVPFFSNTLPEISGPGVAILSAKAGGGLRELSGTSMATPHVAGAAVLWWQQVSTSPQLMNAHTVTARLLASARTDVFVPDLDVADRGVGMVTAP